MSEQKTAATVGDQMRMYAADDEDHRAGDAPYALVLVGQHDVRAFFNLHCVQCFRANALDGGAQRLLRRLAGQQRRGAIDNLYVAPQRGDHAVVHAVGEERAGEHVNIGLGFVLRQDVAEVFEPRGEAHHPAFAQRVDRRIGDLTEVLPEIVRQRARLF